MSISASEYLTTLMTSVEKYGTDNKVPFYQERGESSSSVQVFASQKHSIARALNHVVNVTSMSNDIVCAIALFFADGACDIKATMEKFVALCYANSNGFSLELSCEFDDQTNCYLVRADTIDTTKDIGKMTAYVFAILKIFDEIGNSRDVWLDSATREAKSTFLDQHAALIPAFANAAKESETQNRYIVNANEKAIHVGLARKCDSGITRAIMSNEAAYATFASTDGSLTIAIVFMSFFSPNEEEIKDAFETCIAKTARDSGFVDPEYSVHSSNDVKAVPNGYTRFSFEMRVDVSDNYNRVARFIIAALDSTIQHSFGFAPPLVEPTSPRSPFPESPKASPESPKEDDSVHCDATVTASLKGAEQLT
jgi:hypothetical protein